MNALFGLVLVGPFFVMQISNHLRVTEVFPNMISDVGLHLACLQSIQEETMSFFALSRLQT